jgi:hypothetical protein
MNLTELKKASSIFNLGATMQFVSQLAKHIEDNVSQDKDLKNAMLDTAIELLQNLKDK